MPKRSLRGQLKVVAEELLVKSQQLQDLEIAQFIIEKVGKSYHRENMITMEGLKGTLIILTMATRKHIQLFHINILGLGKTENQPGVDGTVKKKEIFNMRLCLTNDDQNLNLNPFYLNELLVFLGNHIKEFNWVFSDIVAHVFIKGEEVTVEEFEKETFILSGNELYSYIQKYDILLIFGVVMCVNKDIKLNDIKEFPFIQDNESYWDKDYTSPLPNTEIEFGIFDTTVVIITTGKSLLVNILKKQFPNICTLDYYLEEN